MSRKRNDDPQFRLEKISLCLPKCYVDRLRSDKANTMTQGIKEALELKWKLRSEINRYIAQGDGAND